MFQLVLFGSSNKVYVNFGVRACMAIAKKNPLLERTHVKIKEKHTHCHYGVMEFVIESKQDTLEFEILEI